MKFWRNPEVQKLGALLAAITLTACIAAFIINTLFGFFTLALCLIFSAVFLIFTAARYRKLAALCESVDKVLQGDDGICFSQYSEGELAILGDEIAKMTVRLREQRGRLTEEKLLLADSIADISHQIRTPLTSINLLLSFLAEPELTYERRQQLTAELLELLDRIDRLITALLKISRLDAGTVKFNRAELGLAQLIDKAAAPLAIPMELREQALTVKASGCLNADLFWTAEALCNILKNCMEHTPQGGRLTVTAAQTPIYAKITIEDSGPGLNEADLPHIFERFYKGAGSAESSVGIGLALARMIITAQGGVIKAENRPEGGARFIIKFHKGAV